MQRRYNDKNHEALVVRIEPDGTVFVNGKKHLTLKQAALRVDKGFKTVSAWTVRGNKPGFLDSVCVFGTKLVCEDDLVSYKANLRHYVSKLRIPTK